MNNKRKWEFSHSTLSHLIVVLFGVSLYMALANLGAVRLYFRGLVSIISPFVVGIVIAYLLNMPVRFFRKKIFSKLRFGNALAILVVYILFSVFFFFLLGLVFPQVVESIRILLGNIPQYLQNLNNAAGMIAERFGLEPDTIQLFVISSNDLVRKTADILSNSFPDLLNITFGFATSIISALTALIASIYMLVSKEKLVLQCKRVCYALLPKQKANSVVRISRLSNQIFSGFISGKLLDSAIIGAICFVFMWTTNAFFYPMPFAPLISIIIAITNIIPFFGPFIGAIPSVMILLLASPTSAIWFIIFIILLQQFDGNILGPKILGDSTGLPALWVLISIVVGGGLFGFVGMVMGVPTAAVLYTLSSEIIAGRLAKKGISNQDICSSSPIDDGSSPPNESNEALEKPL